MSIADKIIRLQNAKDAIASAIDEQGGLVNDGDGYEEFADDIRTIRSSSTKTDYYMLADTMDSSGLSGARTHAPHNVGPASVVSITGAMGNIPFENVTIDANYVQSGSGEPSTSNIRPFTPYTTVNVVVSPTLDATQGTTYGISLSSLSKTVYAGVIDLKKNTFMETYELITLTGDEPFGRLGSGEKYYYRYDICTDGRYHGGSYVGAVISSHYLEKSITTGTTNVGIAIQGSGDTRRLAIRPENASTSTVTTFKAFLKDQYDNGTPVQALIKYTEGFEPEQNLQRILINSYAGTNNVWADSGNISLTYYDDTAATWVTTPPTPNAYAKYLWWYYHLAFANGDTEDSPPALIGVYNQDWHEESQLAMSAAQAAQSTADAAVASISDILTNGTTFNGAVTFAGDVSYTKNSSPVSIPSSFETIESAISSVRSRQNNNLFYYPGHIKTLHLMDYAQGNASSGVYLILLRAWTTSATSGAIYLVSFITGKNTAMTCIESSSLATLSVNYNTDEVTITFPTQDNQGNYPGGMVAILGGPVI